MRVRRWLADWVVPHLCEDKLEGTTREWDRLHNPLFQPGKKEASKPLTEKNLWGLRSQEKLPASQESSL